MKFPKVNILRYLTLFIIIMYSSICMAQPSKPPGNPAPLGGLWVLLVTGALYGYNKINKK